MSSPFGRRNGRQNRSWDWCTRFKPRLCGVFANAQFPISNLTEFVQKPFQREELAIAVAEPFLWCAIAIVVEPAATHDAGTAAAYKIIQYFASPSDYRRIVAPIG